MLNRWTKRIKTAYTTFAQNVPCTIKSHFTCPQHQNLCMLMGLNFLKPSLLSLRRLTFISTPTAHILDAEQLNYKI